MLRDFDHYGTPEGLDGTPYTYFEELRDWSVEEDVQIGWSEKHGGFWVVLGYDAAKDLHQKTEDFSNREPTFPAYGTPGGRPTMLAGNDEPDHTKYRKLVQGPFSPKAAANMAELLRATTNDLIDGFIEDGRADVVAGLANEVPARATAIILGLPPEDGDVYRTWTHAMAQQKHTEPEEAAKHIEQMGEVFRDLLAERRRSPGDDILSGVAHAEVEGERLNDQEIYDFFVVLLVGGIDNTTKLLSNMLWRLSWDRELRRRLIVDPKLIPTAVEECLRYYSPAMTVRAVKGATSFHGVELEPGQFVVMALPIINRDPRQFPDPDVFIPDRSPNRHLALGLGIHRCLGAHLLKVEARVAAEEFLRRVPEFELDPEGSTAWLHGQVGGMQQVPIVFPPGPRENGYTRLATN